MFHGSVDRILVSNYEATARVSVSVRIAEEAANVCQ